MSASFRTILIRVLAAELVVWALLALFQVRYTA
jgi:hypothetical protein